MTTPKTNPELPVGLPFGIIDPDYARIFTQARIIAWQYGYACVMHGSFTRDLDLLLVPWEARAASNHDQLLKMIAEAGGLKFRDGEEVLKATVDWSEKPHGRKACSLYFPGFHDRRWIDISVMPCASPPLPPVQVAA
jgi:hypothetical protein